jgi:hypothetical protein
MALRAPLSQAGGVSFIRWVSAFCTLAPVRRMCVVAAGMRGLPGRLAPGRHTGSHYVELSIAIDTGRVRQ